MYRIKYLLNQIKIDNLLKQIIKSMKSKSSAGLDDVSPEILKMYVAEMIHLLVSVKQIIRT